MSTELDMGGPPDGVYGEASPAGGPPDGLATAGRVNPGSNYASDWSAVQNPYTMTDKEIATKVLKLSPDEWAKLEASNAYKMGGPLRDRFTEPGSFMTRAGGPTLNSVRYGYNTATRSARQLIGSLLPKSVGGAGEKMDEIYQKLDDMAQNINQGRDRNVGGFDPAAVATQGVVSMAGTKGQPMSAAETALARDLATVLPKAASTVSRSAANLPKGYEALQTVAGESAPLGSLAARTAANTANAVTGTYATTPGGTGDRASAAAFAGLVTPAAQLAGEVALPWVKKTGKQILQKAMGIDDTAMATAAQRTAVIDALNEKLGTSLEPTVAQLTGSPLAAKFEAASTRIPGGLSKTRVAGNAQNKAMVESWNNQLHQELSTTPWSSVDQLMEAVSHGNENASRILNALDLAGNDVGMVAKASPDVAMFPKRQAESSLHEEFGRLANPEGPIDVSGAIAKIDDSLANMRKIAGDDSPAVRTLQNLRDDLSSGMNSAFPPTAPDVVSPETALDAFRIRNKSAPFSQEAYDKLLPGNIKKSVSKLGDEAAAYRNSGAPGSLDIAGELDQARTPLKQRFNEAVSNLKNPNSRAALDEANTFSQREIQPYTRTSEAVTLRNIDLPDKVIPTFYQPDNPGMSKWFANALDDKGQAAVRAYTAEQALNKGNAYGGADRGIFNNAKAASELERLPTDPFFNGAHQQQLDDLRRSLQWTRENADVAANPVNGATNTPFNAATMAMSGFRGAMGVIGIGPGLKYLMGTPEGRALLLSKGYGGLAAPTELATNYMPRFFGDAVPATAEDQLRGDGY